MWSKQFFSGVPSHIIEQAQLVGHLPIRFQRTRIFRRFRLKHSMNAAISCNTNDDSHSFHGVGVNVGCGERVPGWVGVGVNSGSRVGVEPPPGIVVMV